MSFGLSTGLTNLLAEHCIDALGAELRNLGIFNLRSLEEAHGEAAVRWNLENLDKRFEDSGGGGRRSTAGIVPATLGWSVG